MPRVYAVNAVSLVIAVAANIVFLAHMVKCLPVLVALPLAIAGWYYTSLLLIGLVATAPAHLMLPAGEDRTFSQAYYYAIFAAAIYSILTSMLVVTSL